MAMNIPLDWRILVLIANLYIDVFEFLQKILTQEAVTEEALS